MVKSKISYKFVLKYLALFFVCLVLSNGNINGISPFLFAFYFAGLYAGVDEKLLSAFTLASAVAVDVSLPSFYSALTVVAVGLVVFYFHKIIKKRIRFWEIVLFYLLSLITFVFYARHDVLGVVLYLVLGMVCLYGYVVVMQSLTLRKNCFKLTLNESICFLFCIATLGIGVASISVFNVEIYRFVLMLLVFVFTAVGNLPLTLALTLAFSLGVGLSQFSIAMVAEFAILAMLGGMFGQPNKLKTIILTIATDLFLQYYFFSSGLNILYNLIPVIVASLILLITPKRTIDSLADFVYVKRSELSTRNLINNTRRALRRRMSELSNVFMEMKQIHLKLVKKGLNKEELTAMLVREVNSTCCKDCLDKNHCTRAMRDDNKTNLEYLVETALTKGKLTLLDLPSSLTNRCAKINQVITLINRLSDEYKQYKNMIADVNNVKILLADQMGAVGKLLLDLGEEIDSNVTFDVVKENKIINKLLNNDIECGEVLLYNEKQDMSVVLILKGKVPSYPVLEKLITDCMKMPMQISQVSPLEDGGLTSVTLRKSNKYDCVFGLASCNKAGNVECGDCHSIIRLTKDRFLLALCDGMGSGQSAHKMSSMTLGLIENFYKAGFDNDVVLESVNKLLAINNGEDYSTLDICLVDLNNNIADFIKVGAPFSAIKREGSIELLEGGALPIGALESITPSTYKTTISTKDIVVMATDGITDAFKSQDNFVEFINHVATNNPQTIAEAVLNEAMRLNNMEAKDDMTVLVARTYLKNLK